jgi:hypothetical protein
MVITTKTTCIRDIRSRPVTVYLRGDSQRIFPYPMQFHQPFLIPSQKCKGSGYRMSTISCK